MSCYTIDCSATSSTDILCHIEENTDDNEINEVAVVD